MGRNQYFQFGELRRKAIGQPFLERNLSILSAVLGKLSSEVFLGSGRALAISYSYSFARPQLYTVF